jgi:hypothetical protein
MKTPLLPILMVLIPAAALATPDEPQLPAPPLTPATDAAERPVHWGGRERNWGSDRTGQFLPGRPAGDPRVDLPYGAGFEARQRGPGWGGGRGFGRGRR